MREVMTVLGPVVPEELGFTSMHDHILVDLRVWRREWESLIPDDFPVSGDDPVSLENIGLLQRDHFLVADNLVLDDEEVMTAEMADFKAAGGGAMVEMSSIGLRVSLPAIQRISRKSGIHVVATTGFYVEQSCPEHAGKTIEQFTDLMVKEIEEGIEGTDIKAGHIKIGVTTLSERDVRVLKAAARTSMQTGLSVSVHPGHGGSDGRRIVDILLREGMNPERIIINHTDYFLVEHDIRVLFYHPDQRGIRLDYAKELLDRGVNISMDCFGHSWDRELRDGVGTRDWQRIVALLALIDAGYASQIVWGTDTCFKMLVRRYGGVGYCRLTNYVVPTLKAQDVSDYDIRLMTVDNPARLLAY
jgi:phosphotriesterase-related protein